MLWLLTEHLKSEIGLDTRCNPNAHFQNSTADDKFAMLEGKMDRILELLIAALSPGAFVEYHPSPLCPPGLNQLTQCCST